MSREKDAGKKFSEYVDRILAGEDIKDDPAMDRDLREALEFARKIIGTRSSPSVKFQASLKASLLQKLDEREERAREKQGRSWGLFWRQPAWQAVVIVFLIVIIGSILWRTGVFLPASPLPSVTTAPTATATSPPPMTTSAPLPGELVSVTARTDRTSYRSGDVVNIEVELKNDSAGSLTLEKMPPIISLMSVETAQPVYTFSAGTETRTLAPGEAARFNLTWPQLDFTGRPVTGDYYLELEDLELKGRPVQLNLIRPVRFEISPDATPGAGSGTIEVDRSQAASGITVTLRRVVISDTGVIVNAFISPPRDYSVFRVETGYRASRDYSAPATYTFDGGWVKDAGMSAIEYLQNGMNQTWYIPDTVPPGAAEMFFNITSVGDWPGPWTFYIPLK
ncbi:MAG: hypothetical protein A2Z29_09235 [Chloroflexi bacterium RBG_16_56_11]|nr:MAG: hypothetical protein A2Z29_09235 [Chloroflexi bacterium RBG_16_56_11]